jgi:hypothetical protein
MMLLKTVVVNFTVSGHTQGRRGIGRRGTGSRPCSPCSSGVKRSELKADNCSVALD